MEWIEPVTTWAKSNNALLWWIVAGSVALLVLSPIAVGWALVRLPRDYFTNERRRPLGSWSTRPALRLGLLAGKNLLGIVLIAAGLLMLFVPGQGLLTIAVGLVLT